MSTDHELPRSTAGMGAFSRRRALGMMAAGLAGTAVSASGIQALFGRTAVAQSELLANPGFEEVESGLPTDWQVAYGSGVSSSTERVHGGALSVKLVDSSASSAVGLRSTAIQIDPTQAYRASVYTYIEEGSAHLYLEYRDPDGQRISFEQRATSVGQTWQQIVVEALPPSGAVSATVLLYLDNQNVGTAYYDNASLHVVTELLANPGFEEVESGLPTGWQVAYGSGVSSSTERVHGGALSVKLVDSSASSAVGLRSSSVPIDPSQAYRASVYAYVEDGGAHLYLEYRDANNQRVSFEQRFIGASQTWQQIVVETLPPCEAVSATVLLYLGQQNTGAAYFDDASLNAAEDPTTCPGPPAEVFGPASLTARLNGAGFSGDLAYVLTRTVDPAIIAEVDLSTREVTKQATLQSGTGGWGVAVSGGHAYAATYLPAGLHRFDPASSSETATRVATFGGNAFCYSLAAAPDGVLYVGTYGDGHVWEYSPATDQLKDLGVVIQQGTRVLALAADETTVYAAAGIRPGGLIAIDRADGTKLDITPPELGETSFGAVEVSADRIVASCAISPAFVDIPKDGSDPNVIRLAGGLLYALAIASDGTVYGTKSGGADAGTLYRYRPGDTALTALTEPGGHGAGRAALHLLDDNTLVGMRGKATELGNGQLWWRDLQAESTEYLGIVAAGLEPGPENPQSIAVDPLTAVYVGGGGGGIQIHELSSDNEPESTRRVGVPGNEAKAMAVADHRLYAAMYPSADIVEYDPATDAARIVGEIGHNQERPAAMVYDGDTGLLLVASAPGGSLLSGALSVYDPETESLDVYPDIIPDEAVKTVTVANGIAYIGGDIHGDNPGDSDPIQTEAHVVAFDLSTRTALWQTVPLPGQETIYDLVEHDGLLYGVMQRDIGNWFVMDLATRDVIQTDQIAGRGDIVAHRGQVYVITAGGGGNVYHLGPDVEEAKLLVTGPFGGWFTQPQLATDPTSYAWSLVGLNLARIRLDWRCPPARIGIGGCPEVSFDDAVALVNEYYDAGVLDRSQRARMLVHLSVAERMADRGLIPQAERALGRFVDVAAGVADDEARAELIGMAEALTARLADAPG